MLISMAGESNLHPALIANLAKTLASSVPQFVIVAAVGVVLRNAVIQAVRKLEQDHTKR